MSIVIIGFITCMIKDYDYLYKLVIVGDTGVGKSSLLLRFADNQFYDNYLATIGVDFRFKTMNVDGKLVKFQIWDTAGQERFRTITSAYYKGSHGILLVYDITDGQSYQDIDKFWLQEVENYAEKDVELYLIGNKSDLVERRATPTADVDEYCRKKKMTRRSPTSS
jgi:Ras-related protein Rab-1A